MRYSKHAHTIRDEEGDFRFKLDGMEDLCYQVDKCLSYIILAGDP